MFLCREYHHVTLKSPDLVSLGFSCVSEASLVRWPYPVYTKSLYFQMCLLHFIKKSFYLLRVADFSLFLLNLHLYEVFCLTAWNKLSAISEVNVFGNWIFFPALEVKLSFCLSILFFSWIIVSCVRKVCDWLVQFLFLFYYFFVVPDLEPGIFGSVFCIT